MNLSSEFSENYRATSSCSGELLVASSQKLEETIVKLKNNFGFIMLVDIFAQDLSELDGAESNNKNFEVCYILLNMELHFRLKVTINVDHLRNEILPSFSGLWPGAAWCEREVYEMFGISFGESSEKKLLTDPTLANFPLRKNFEEPEYTEGKFEAINELSPVKNLAKYKTNLLDDYSIGPIHPGLKGSMKLNLRVEGDDIYDSSLEFGFLHRAIEKQCENSRYSQILPLTDRLNYYSSSANNVGWAKAIEDLVGLEISDRSKALRMVVCELSRITDHAQCIGSMAQASRSLEPLEVTTKIRNIIFDLFENFSGARVTHNLCRIGGMSRELPIGWANDCLIKLKDISKYIEEINSYLTKYSFWTNNLATANLNAYEAISWGVTGPNLRACGVNYDIRKASPYYFYEDVEFEIPLGINGDNYDRYLVRLEEMRQSIKIITQVLDSLPPGKASAEFVDTDLDLSLLNFKPKTGEVYSMTEAPNGELGFFIKSIGEVTPYRVKMRTPSFFSAQAFSNMLIGTKSTDALVSLCSMNIVASEVDR